MKKRSRNAVFIVYRYVSCNHRKEEADYGTYWKPEKESR